MRRVPRLLSLESLALVSTLLLFPRIAHADPYKAKLSVQLSPDASGCEDASLLAGRINRIAARDAITNGDTTVDIAIRVDRHDKKFHAHLTAYGATEGDRDFEDDGQTCRGLDEAVAVSVALLLDEAPERTREAAPTPTPVAAAPPVEDPAEKPPPLPKPPPPPPETTVEIYALGTAAVVGGATFGTEAAFEVRVRPLLTVGAGIFGLIQDEERFASGGLWVNLVGVRVPACLSLRTRDRSTGGGFCGFPALGVLHASGHDFDVNANASQPWFAMGASGMVFGPLSGPIGLVGRVDLVVPLYRPTFVVQNLGNARSGESGPAYQPKPVGFAAGVGVRTLIR